MPPQLFIKFHYKDRIKKAGFSEEDFTWDSVCKVLQQSFNIPTNSLKITYKDSDGDEITVCCDEDLLEVLRSSPDQRQARFFVYKCNPVLNKARTMSDDTSSQLEQSSNSFRERSLTASFSDNNIAVDIRNPRLERIPSVVKEEHSAVHKESNVEDINPNHEIKLEAKELSELLNLLFATSQGKKALADLKTKHSVSKDIKDNKDAKFVVSIADREALYGNIVEIMTRGINESEDKVSEENEKEKKNIDLNKSIDSEIATEEEYKSLEEKNLINKEKTAEKDFFNSSLKESFYGENHLNNTFKERRTVADFKTKSLAQTYGSKDLSSTFGVKLALKCVNGKMKMVSVPLNDYCVIEADEHVEKDKKELGAVLQKSASENNIAASEKKAPEEEGIPERYRDLYKQLLFD